MHGFDPTIGETMANEKTTKSIDFSRIALYRKVASDIDFGTNRLHQGLPLEDIVHK